jgi:glycosyltransferase involved in cell wall biosynthesis
MDNRYISGYLKSTNMQSSFFDIDRWTWKRKLKHWSGKQITFTTGSKWLADCVKNSELFRDNRVEVIPNGLNLNIYKPIEKTTARNILNLPKNKQLILFGAVKSLDDKRKGFHLLREALGIISDSAQNLDIELVIYGASTPQNPPELGFKCHYTGYLHDEYSLALLYSACDVFVAPSMMENLPFTVMEALACGSPSVAFNIGGMPDLIQHKKNGFLASPFDIKELAAGIVWVLEDHERKNTLERNARQQAESDFSIELQTSRYIDLYNEICKT